MLLYQLLRPFGYLTIRHPVKRTVDWNIPICATALGMIMVAVFRLEINVWANSGLVSLALGFVQSLPGFYIAALAAVATFGNPQTMDALLPDPTPTISTYSDVGANIVIGLTRRRFLCFLFAFLTAESILLTLFSVFSVTFGVAIKQALPLIAREPVFYLGTSLYMLLLFQMIIVTLWGLYYLADKMHHPAAY